MRARSSVRLEHRTFNPRVAGSIPVGPALTFCFFLFVVVFCLLALLLLGGCVVCCVCCLGLVLVWVLVVRFVSFCCVLNGDSNLNYFLEFRRGKDEWLVPKCCRGESL